MDQQQVYANGYYGANPYFAPQQQYANPAMSWGFQPQVPNPNFKAPNFTNALSTEEISILRSDRGGDRFNISVSQNDALRSICTHKENNHSAVFKVNDGSADVWCPICNERWNSEMMTKEQVTELVNQLIDQMQNAKWVGDMPVQTVREYFTMIPLLKKFPDLYEVASSQFNKYADQNATYNANEYNAYAQYHALTSNYGVPMGGYPYPQYQQPYVQQGQPMPQNDYYYQAPQGQTPMANPYANPMQAPAYDVNPMAPNQQFVQQANMMMNQPVYGTPQPYQPAPQTQQPQQQPAAPAQQATPAPEQAQTTTEAAKFEV